MTKNIVLQWGELPTSVAYIGTGQIMGWGNKAIEIRSVETGHLDGVFMHKKAQKLKFLCERNDKVRRLKLDQTKLFHKFCLYRFSSPVLRGDPLVKSTSWLWTSLAWLTGSMSRWCYYPQCYPDSCWTAVIVTLERVNYCNYENI